MDKIRELAIRLVSWYADWDLYGFQDNYGDGDRDPLEDCIRLLRDRKSRKGIMTALHDLVEEVDDDNEAEEIATLYRQIVAL